MSINRLLNSALEPDQRCFRRLTGFQGRCGGLATPSRGLSRYSSSLDLFFDRKELILEISLYVSIRFDERLKGDPLNITQRAIMRDRGSTSLAVSLEPVA
jgi:hypothetical protein